MTKKKTARIIGEAKQINAIKNGGIMLASFRQEGACIATTKSNSESERLGASGFSDRTSSNQYCGSNTQKQT